MRFRNMDFPPPSMRPRFANRGSARCRHFPAPVDWAFNEAPIRESGKLRADISSPPETAAFNEAPIRESGKFP